jgi:hypothetical protein
MYAASLLRHAGYYVFNPVEQDELFAYHGTPEEPRFYLEHDLPWLCRWAEVIGLMHGWQCSKGAVAEMKTADACDIEIWELPDEYHVD